MLLSTQNSVYNFDKHTSFLIPVLWIAEPELRRWYFWCCFLLLLFFFLRFFFKIPNTLFNTFTSLLPSITFHSTSWYSYLNVIMQRTIVYHSDLRPFLICQINHNLSLSFHVNDRFSLLLLLLFIYFLQIQHYYRSHFANFPTLVFHYST
jgi:hypothetical protein